jgi:putative chitinase
MARQTVAFVRTNAFLRGLTRDQLAEFFGPRIAFGDGLLGRRDILARWGLDTPLRLAHFLAEAAYESNGFGMMEEKLAYSANRLRPMFPRHFKDDGEAKAFDRKPERIANRIYANSAGNGDEASGDGWRFRGRGLFLLAGRSNYRAVGRLLGMDLESEPDLMATDPEIAFASAAVWWHARKLNELADQDDLRGITRRINGGMHGLDRRRDWLARARSALGIPAGDTGLTTGTS